MDDIYAPKELTFNEVLSLLWRGHVNASMTHLDNIDRLDAPRKEREKMKKAAFHNCVQEWLKHGWDTASAEHLRQTRSRPDDGVGLKT